AVEQPGSADGRVARLAFGPARSRRPACQAVTDNITQGLPSVGQGKSSGGSGSYSPRCSSRRSVPPVRSPGQEATTSSVTGSSNGPGAFVLPPGRTASH